MGAARTSILKSLYSELVATDPEMRLSLLEIAFPALKLRPEAEINYVVELARRMIEIDGEIDLYEFCFYRVMTSNLEKAAHPLARPERAKRGELRTAAISLLRIIADYGHDNDADRKAAFAAGIATLGPWADKQEFRSDRNYTIETLDRGLDALRGLNGKGQESFMKAIGAAVAHDGRLAVAEAELMRTICATLEYPLPPILGNDG
jgi:hypothetical protein